MESSGTDTFSIEVTGRGFHRRRGESAAPPVLTARLLPARDEAARSARSLRLLYLFRAGFSAAWVALVISLTASPVAGATLSVLAEILLVIYPLSDAAATLFDIRATPAAPKIAQYVNLAAGIAAAAGVLLALFSGLAGAIAVFGGWAVLSGATMVIVAMRRRRTLGGQWLMIISGAGSIFAGTTFVRWAGSPAAGLATLAQYSAGGAFWYLLAVLWLLRSRPSPPPPAQLGRAGGRDRPFTRDGARCRDWALRRLPAV